MTAAAALAVRSLKDLYPGPRPFLPDEAHLFFGRDQEAANLRDLALSYRMMLLYARSGAGKSSLVNARLLDALKHEGFTALRGRVAGDLPPDLLQTRDPGFNVHTFHALTSLAGDAIRAEDARRMSLGDYIGRLNREAPYYVVFDQFEEFFTVHPDRWRDRRPFFEQLQKVLRENENVHVLLVIREDYVASLDPFSDLAPGGLRFRFRLERLRQDQAKAAIEQPLLRAGLRFESPEIVNDFLKELSKERIELGREVIESEGEYIEPMHLQVVCRSLVEKLPAGTTVISRAALSTYGNVDETLSEYYNGAISGSLRYYRQRSGLGEMVLSAFRKREGAEARLRRWFDGCLITKSGTRGFMFMGDARSHGVSELTIRRLAEERMVQVERRAGAEWVELTHDRFIGPVVSANHAWRVRRRQRILAIAGPLLLAAMLGGLAAREHGARQAASAAEAERKTAVREAERADQDSEKYVRTLLTQWGVAPGPGPLDRTSVNQRIQANTALKQLQIEGQCSGSGVLYFPNSRLDAGAEALLRTAWTEIGLRIDKGRGNPSLNNRLWNAVWKGADVPIVCVKAVALSLVRAGSQLQQVGYPIELHPEQKKQMIQVGVSAASTQKSFWTVQKILDLR